MAPDHHQPVGTLAPVSRDAPLLLHAFPSFTTGGAQVRFAAIANRFPRAWRHAVVAMDGNTGCRARLAPDLDVQLLPAPHGDPAARLRGMRVMLTSLRPALLVTSNWGTIEWALARCFTGIGHLHMEDGFGPDERDGQKARRVWARRLLLRGSTTLLPSRLLLGIARDVWRLPPARLRHVPNGVDLRRFRPEPHAGDGDVVIGVVAALRAEKNLARLLRAFALTPPHLRLEIVGEGPELAALQSLAVTLGIAGRVCFTGPLADPAPGYRRFDIFALSSDTEQMPLSVLEAMASGLPVVACDVGDIRLMVDAANAPFIVAREDGALAAAIAALADDVSLRRHIGQANRLRAEQEFDEERMFQTHAGLFAELAR